jgi:uncharacterized protein (UPF0332 family)
MRWKARENLSAAKLLLGAADSHFNSCVSRAYYAAYQACWAAMVVEGHPPTPDDRGAYFRHATLPKEAREAGVLNAQQSKDLGLLERWRVVADYLNDLLTKEQATQACDLAARLVDALVDEDG